MNPLLEKSKEESTRVTVLDRGEIFATFLCKERAVTQSSCSRNENISRQMATCRNHSRVPVIYTPCESRKSPLWLGRICCVCRIKSGQERDALMTMGSQGGPGVVYEVYEANLEHHGTQDVYLY